ncbi:DNA polymerase III subunit beta [Buchnera aphidicola]|uniref:DNA polymerase III subunit beta n=1 Tax=Buchnera aphidicola TaxID=9 RepID=UPI0034647632
MKFIIKKNKLLKPLQKLNSIICINHEYPMTSNILLEFQENYIFLTSTNLELELTTKIKLLNHHNNYSIVISGKKIFNVIRSFPNDINLQITCNTNNIYIAYENIQFTLNTISANNFPKFSQEKNTTNITLPQEKIKNIIHHTAFSMAKQDIRHYLNGMYLEINKNKIFAIATDGYRMALCNTTIHENNIKISIIIPRKTIMELIKILQDCNTPLKICIGLKMVKFEINEYILFSKLIDNEFPDYKNLFLQEFQTILKINRKKLKTSLMRAAILTNRKFPGVKLYFHKEKCILSAKNENNEIIKETIQICNTNDPIELTMNIHYILDVINVLQNEFITIYLNNNISRIYIQNLEKYHSFYIIMPLII